MGVPFTIFVCLICLSLWRVLNDDQNYGLQAPYRKYWAMPLYSGIIDVFECIFSCGRSPLPPITQIRGFFGALLLPQVFIGKVLAKRCDGKDIVHKSPAHRWLIV